MVSAASASQPSTGQPRIFTKPFFLNAFVNLLLYINYYVLMVVMAGYCLVTYNASAATAGFAASIFIVGALFARFLGGALIDQFGRKHALILGTFCMTVCSFAYFLPIELEALLILRVVHGLFYGIAQTAISSIATETIPNERKGEGVGYFMLSATLGSAVGPFLGTSISEYLNYDVLFGLYASAMAIGFICSFFVKDPHHEYKKHQKSLQSPSTHARFSLRSFLEFRALPISLCVCVALLAYGSVMTYLDSFAAEHNMMQAASIFFVVYSIVMFIARPFTGKIFDRKGDFGVMVAGFLSFAAGMICIGFAQNGVLLLIAACFLGFGVGTINPCGLTLAVKRSPAYRLTAANSTFSCFNDATIGLAPVLFGWTIPLVGYNGLFLLLTGVVLVALLMYVVFRFRGMIA